MPIFYSALMLTGVNLLLRLVSTSFQVYLSGRIGAAGIGLLQLVLSVGSLAITAGMAGIRTATMYLTAEELGHRKPENVRWILSGCFTYSISISALIMAGLYVFAPVVAVRWIGDVRTTQAIRLLAGAVPVSCLCGVMTGYFTAANRIGTLAAVEIAEQACTMGVTLLGLSLWAGSDPGRACQAVIFGSTSGAALTLICLMILRMRERQEPGPRIPVRSRLLKAAVPLALADDLKVGINTVENLMVPRRLALYAGTLAPLASFGTVCGMVFPILMFPAAILYGLAELLIPELARCSAAGSQKRIAYLSKRSLKVALLYGCAFCGLMVLASEQLCLTFYDSPEAGAQLKRYALLIPMLYCDAITDAMTKGLGQQKYSVRNNILTSVLDVLLLYLWLPKYGMDGYFLSFTVTHGLNFILSLQLLTRTTGQRLRYGQSALCIGAALVVLWGCGQLPGTVLQCTGFILGLGASLTLLGILSREDLRWLRGLVTGKASQT